MHCVPRIIINADDFGIGDEVNGEIRMLMERKLISSATILANGPAFQEAARVAHKNVSEFLLDAGITAANQTLADRTRFELGAQQWKAFQAALDRPVSAKPKLKKLLSELGPLG